MAIDYVSQGLSLTVGQNGKLGFLDTDGTEVVPFIYDRADDFSDGLASVCEYKNAFFLRRGILKIPLYANSVSSWAKEELYESKKSGLITARTGSSNVSDWAVDATAVLLASGIINGVSVTTLSPKSNATVEQAILFILRAYQRFPR